MRAIAWASPSPTGMSTQQWLEYGFNTSQLPTEVDWDTLVEKGLY